MTSRVKAQVLEFFACLDQLQDGVIELLVVKHGLPFQMHVAVTAESRPTIQITRQRDWPQSGGRCGCRRSGELAATFSFAKLILWTHATPATSPPRAEGGTRGYRFVSLDQRSVCRKPHYAPKHANS